MTKDCSECPHFDVFHTSRACHDCKPWKSSKKKDMTREEAIKELKEDKMLYETDVCHAGDGTPDGRLLEALDMAIEALKTDAVHDGCDGCRYEQNTGHEYPCKDCKQNYMDMWEQKPNDSVSVVRCKDCRHANECHKSVQYTRNELNTVTIGYSQIEWCSRGERREE